MKILENPNPAKSKVHVCERCQCKFEFTERDVKVDVSSDANGRIGGTHYYSRQVLVERRKKQKEECTVNENRIIHKQ